VWTRLSNSFVEQRRGARQGCILSLYVFNTFINDVIVYINKYNVHAPMIGKMSVPGLLFAYDLAIGSFTVNGLEKGTDQVVKYCRA
jgi:hypothetical protein